MNRKLVPSINALYPAINGLPLLYYQDVIESLDPPKDVGIILVAHSYETVFALAASMENLGNLRGVILKNSTSTRFPLVAKELSQTGTPVLEISKNEMVHNMQSVVEKISRSVKDVKQFILLDHGGYFAFSPELFKAFPPEQLIGVAEHTLNGEERYKTLGLTDRPIVSIGTSSIKLPSDEAAADAIVHASDGYLQTGGLNLYSSMLRVGIIGYGRLGRRIGHQLGIKGAPQVLVNDIDASALACAKEHSLAEKESLCTKCNVIFCATGNGALEPKHYSLLKNNTILFTVTSPDDELRLGSLLKDNILEPVPNKRRGDTFVYKVVETGNEIILPFNGESPNTSLPYGISDPIIHQAYAAHIAAAIAAMDPPRFGVQKGLQGLSPDLERTVSKLWIRHFGNFEAPDSVRPLTQQILPQALKSGLAPV